MNKNMHKTLRTCVIVTSLLISSSQVHTGIGNTALQYTKILAGSALLLEVGLHIKMIMYGKLKSKCLEDKFHFVFAPLGSFGGGLLLIENGIKGLRKKPKTPKHSEFASN